ncbi:trimethyllysine dioxygenase, mitochondrial-like [Antedon mediterranea]|uniref:trimethyllysine dioxygenase, mitochondrial-like n=1 Tax=Antedon mediterranea TaxID=105859 RepID=UPI003AF43C2D
MNNICRTRVLSALISTLQTTKNKLGKVYFSSRSTFKLTNTNLNQIHVLRQSSTGFSAVKDQLCAQHEDYLELPVESAVPLKIPYVWLRDHCRCSECYNQKTNQRLFDSFVIDVDEAPVSVESYDDKIKLTWKDTHVTTYNLSWLKQNSPGSNLQDSVKKVLWNGEKIQKEMPDDVPYKDFMNNDESLKEVLMNIHKYGFGIVGECPPTEEKTVELSERIGHVRPTFFGKSWGFTDNEVFDDTAYTSDAIGPHNDNTYLLEASGIQVFHILHHDGEGGENLLVDGFNAASILKLKHPDYYEALARIPIRAEYIGDGHEVISIINLIQENKITKEIDAFRYNPFDRALLSHTSFEDTKLFYKALKALSAEINSPLNELRMKLTPGRVLFVDNWRVLHGRNSFNGSRVLAGCYLPKDQLNSRLRTIAGLNIY